MQVAFNINFANWGSVKLVALFPSVNQRLFWRFSEKPKSVAPESLGHEQRDAYAACFTRLTDIGSYSQHLCQCRRASRSLLHVQTISSRTGYLRARAEAFFIEQKREHGRQLCEQVMRGWTQLAPKVSVDCEWITLPNFNLQFDWKTGPSSWVKGKVVLRERTIAYYAYQHLLSGYTMQHNSLKAMTSAARAYHDIAKDNVPKIRAQLASEVESRMRLSDKITDYLGDSYNLNLLCAIIAEHVLFKTSLSFLDVSSYVPITHKEFWELRLDGRTDQILSRTRDKADAERLRESIGAVLNDKDVSNYLNAMGRYFREFVGTLSTFKMGINDIVYGVQLGRIIDGDCEICEQYS
jgi:hypothetical protein